MTADMSPYAGRWVALVDDLVAGVGHTADEAMRLALRNRPKEKVQLRFVEEDDGEELALSPLLDRLRPLLAQQRNPVYLVGGAIRDALLGRTSHDLDFVLSRQAIKLSFKVADKLGVPAYVLDQERDTGRVVLPEDNTTFDFARFRGADLEADLRDRDFTINAMALPATAKRAPSIIDPCGGAQDLAMGRIRQTHDQAVASDPIRALRAVRLAASLGFSLTDETAAAVSDAGELLSGVSIERVRDELLKLLQTALPHQAMAAMAQLGLLPFTLPEIDALQNVAQSSPHFEPVFEHTLSVLRWLAKIEQILMPSFESQEVVLAEVHAAVGKYAAELQAHFSRGVEGGLDGSTLLRLGALFHDTGKREAQTIEEDGRIRFFGHDKVGARLAARRLRFLCLSNKAVSHVERTVAGHMRPLFLSTPQKADGGAQVSRRAVYRFFRDSGPAGLDIGMLSIADHLATYNGIGETEQWQRLLSVIETLFHHYFERHSETVAPAPLINGRTVMETLQLEPGPEIGRILRLLEEAQAAGEIAGKDAALQFARGCIQPPVQE